jgi:hypothetical protein
MRLRSLLRLWVTNTTRRIPLRLRLGPRDGIGATTQMVAAPAVISRSRLGNVESFFYLLALRGDTPAWGSLGNRRSRGARRGVWLSGVGRWRRLCRDAGFALSLNGAPGRRHRGIAESWRLGRRGRRICHRKRRLRLSSARIAGQAVYEGGEADHAERGKGENLPHLVVGFRRQWSGLLDRDLRSAVTTKSCV